MSVLGSGVAPQAELKLMDLFGPVVAYAEETQEKYTVMVDIIPVVYGGLQPYWSEERNDLMIPIKETLEAHGFTVEESENKMVATFEGLDGSWKVVTATAEDMTMTTNDGVMGMMTVTRPAPTLSLDYIDGQFAATKSLLRQCINAWRPGQSEDVFLLTGNECIIETNRYYNIGNTNKAARTYVTGTGNAPTEAFKVIVPSSYESTAEWPTFLNDPQLRIALNAVSDGTTVEYDNFNQWQWTQLNMEQRLEAERLNNTLAPSEMTPEQLAMRNAYQYRNSRERLIDKKRIPQIALKPEGVYAAVHQPYGEAQAVITEWITQEQAYQKIMAMQGKFPTGLKWDEAEGGCSAFACYLQRAAFGRSWNGDTNTTATYGPIGSIADMVHHQDLSKIKVGDIISYSWGRGEGGGGADRSTATDGTHVVIVTEVYPDRIVAAEGNDAGKVNWRHEMTFDQLKGNSIPANLTSLINIYSIGTVYSDSYSPETLW
jgi:hypothetical protein